jgi:hypothetical protein
MIISQTYKYLFVELPRTGSTAISRELRQQYDGVQILRKHATYYDFLKIANPEEKEYFVFSCIRNPLDDAVSRYFKLKTNHGERYTDPVKLKKRRNLAERLETRLFNFVHKNNADFTTFFMKSYVLPYSNWSLISRKHYDYIIRFECLQQDFDTALRKIGIDPKRPLPVRNATAKRKRDFHDYYSPQAIEHAKLVFGPFMKEWGFDFPEGWGNSTVPWWYQAEFEFVNILRGFYWRYLRSFV